MVTGLNQNAQLLGQLIGTGLGLYGRSQDRAQQKEDQLAAANLLTQSYQLMETDPEASQAAFIQAQQLAPEFVTKAVQGLALQGEASAQPAASMADSRTSQQKNYEQYQQLKMTDPDAAREFGIAAGFVTPDGKELSVHLQKRLSTATDTAVDSRSNASEYAVLAEEIEKAGFGGGVAGGSWGEKLKEFSGNQDAESQLRRRYYAVRGSQVVKNLPKGAASDTDIALALAGFPSDTASAAEIASFLRGVSKLEEKTADFNEFAANYISENGSEKGMLAAWKKSQEKAEAAIPVDDAPKADQPKLSPAAMKYLRK